MELYPDISLEKSAQALGTRCWIFPQPPFILGYEQPDRVLLSILPDEIGDGPSDILMYVADPLFDKEPYGFSGFPPIAGLDGAPSDPALMVTLTALIRDHAIISACMPMPAFISFWTSGAIISPDRCTGSSPITIRGSKSFPLSGGTMRMRASASSSSAAPKQVAKNRPMR